MSEVANIYDNGPISPIAKIKQNLSVWSENRWMHHRIEYIEPIPRSSTFTVEMVTFSGATTIAANGTITKRLIAFLLMNKDELLHLRWEPVDDVEGRLWELAEAARFAPRGGHARVSRFTHLRDPYLATTTFWILGPNKDIQLEALNPNPIALPSARFAFFGYRYILTPLPSQPAPTPTIYLPAQAMTGTP